MNNIYYRSSNKSCNINSNRTKHTDYARLTSIFRKLDNELEEDKKGKKKVFVKIDKREDDAYKKDKQKI